MNDLLNIDIVTGVHPFPKKVSLLFGQKSEQFISAVSGRQSISIHNHSYHKVVGTPDDRTGSANVTPDDLRCPAFSEIPMGCALARKPWDRPGRLRLAAQSGWGSIKVLNARIEGSWVGDLIGVISLFVMLYILAVFAGISS